MRDLTEKQKKILCFIAIPPKEARYKDVQEYFHRGPGWFYDSIQRLLIDGLVIKTKKRTYQITQKGIDLTKAMGKS
jgi:predicted transcriptional regulator